MQKSVIFQDKSTNTTPFPRFSGAIFHMEAFKVVLDDSSCHRVRSGIMSIVLFPAIILLHMHPISST